MDQDIGVDATSAKQPLPVVLRPALETDMDAVLEIEQGSFGDPWSRSAFLDLIGDPRVAFLVADARGDVLGYVAAWYVLDEGEIGNLAVHESARRQGIGARLLDGAIAKVRASNVDSLYLEVRDSNAAARALYTSRGFAEVGRRKEYYRRPKEDALVLRLDLTPAAPE
ncbi:MAG: ribosomal protein S18-alanine N-acetyltransferase [Gemmatimonadota bacterium]